MSLRGAGARVGSGALSHPPVLCLGLCAAGKAIGVGGLSSAWSGSGCQLGRACHLLGFTCTGGLEQFPGGPARGWKSLPSG